MEQDVAASRVVEVLAEDETLDERRDAVELGFVAQGRNVDAGRVGDLLRTQEVEDDGEEFRVAVDEQSPAFVPKTRNSTGQQGAEERVRAPSQRVAGSRESLPTNVQVYYFGTLVLEASHLM